LSLKLKCVAVSVRHLVPHQFHEPLRRFALDFEHHCPLQCPEPIVHEIKRNEDGRDTNRHEPFIADVSWRMKREPSDGKLVVELPDQRFERRALEPQTERGDATLEKFLVT